jgi:hypothetical protein
MKKVIAILSLLSLFACVPVPAQTIKHTVKMGSSIVPDTTQIRTGSKGSKYFWKLSAKSGKPYKCYIKK